MNSSTIYDRVMKRNTEDTLPLIQGAADRINEAIYALSIGSITTESFMSKVYREGATIRDAAEIWQNLSMHWELYQYKVAEDDIEF